MSKRENRTFLSVKFAFLYSLFLLIILILTVSLHNISAQKVSTDFWTQNLSTLQSSVALLDNDFTIMESYCRQLSQDSDFLRLARMENTQQNNFYLSGLRLKNSFPSILYSYSELPVNSYFIYLRNTDYVASASSFTTANLYHMDNYNPRTFALEDWQSYIFADNQSGRMYPLTGCVVSGSDEAYLYLVDLDTLSYTDIPATAGFHISYQKLKTIFSGVSLEEEGCLLVLDETDTPVLFLSEGGVAMPDTEDFSLDEITEALLALEFDGNFAETDYKDNNMHVTRATSDINSWRFYLIQPASLYTSQYQDFFAIFLIAAILLGLLLIFGLVRNSMRPIMELDHELKETINDRNQLKEVVESTRPILYSTYLQQLMQGTVSSSDEAEYIRGFLQLTEPELRYYVMYGIVYENEFLENTDSLSRNIEELKEIITQELTEYFSYNGMLYSFSPKERVYAILLPFEGKSDEMLISIQERVRKLHNELLEHYSVWFFTGIGLACPFSNIWESYQQAKDASGYTSKNYIFLPYEMIKKDSHVYYYPAEFSTRLVQFISSGSSAQVVEFFDLVHQENIEERSLPFHLLKFLLSDIRNTLLKARFSIAQATKKENAALLEEIDTLLLTEELTFRLCEDIALKLCALSGTKSEKTSLMDTVVEYIRSNFRDPSLCLNKISDEFNISESYFSHMFKETMNINFSVYLEDMRLNEAARLLREGNSNLNEISLEVGYNNQTSFRRAFKKKFGITPSAMLNS